MCSNCLSLTLNDLFAGDNDFILISHVLSILIWIHCWVLIMRPIRSIVIECSLQSLGIWSVYHCFGAFYSRETALYKNYVCFLMLRGKWIFCKKGYSVWKEFAFFREKILLFKSNAHEKGSPEYSPLYMDLYTISLQKCFL